MKPRTLYRHLREDPITALMGEATWRGIKTIRQWRLRNASEGDDCPVRFRPIGYYHCQRELVPEQSRQSILDYADAILGGEYPLMGYGSPSLGVNPDWHCDWVSGKRWPLEASRNLLIVRHDGSDVKVPWELSRLQFAPVVAKAHLLTGDNKYRTGLQCLLTDWIIRNPLEMGVNWTIAMEAALRGISLCLTMDLLWPFAGEEQPWLELLTRSLWQHLRFIEAHSEFSYMLRSNHYLSNIVGLTTLSAYLHGPGMPQRVEKYARAVDREILLQTYPDGGDCEASTGYHVLVAQMFLHSFRVQQRCGIAINREFETRLGLMFQWISALADSEGKLPHIGDCDNGRAELLLDDISQSALPSRARHSLRVGGLSGLASYLLKLGFGGDQADAVWFGGAGGATLGSEDKPISLMRESGVAIARSREAVAVFCAMPNGLGGKGSHTHCDKLSVMFRLGDEEVFCDSGSRGYTRSAEIRNLYRSTKAHNTLVVDGADQNIIPPDDRSLFQCGNEAAVSAIEVSGGGEETMWLRASHRGYARFGIEHQRTVHLDATALLLIDELSGTGEHMLDLRFLLGPEWQISSQTNAGQAVSCVIDGSRHLTLRCEAESPLTLRVLPAEISREYGSYLPASCIQIQTVACLPSSVQTRVRWD
jgi:Heparinase II/III-like protein/Heparinase II/III N-terminus